MSDDKNEKKAASPAWMTGPGGAVPIPVKTIRCRHGITFGVPGGDGAASGVVDESAQNTADGKPQTNINRHKIYFMPWLGCFSVQLYRAGQTQPDGAPLMVPREWVTWIPAA